ncbi:hypothetical protein [Microbulbifer sp. JMSA002]|uniref:hypothetical protein n=1 Tax=Microbulbifer sp. JMSA002 TaxID=3243368 RepID=UPI0040394F44
MKVYVFLMAAIILVACGQADESFRAQMPSGLEITILRISKADVNGVESLTLDYESNVSINDDVEINNELSQVWEGFRKKVDEASLKAAVVRAHNTKSKGAIKTEGIARWYYFHHSSNGEWVQGKPGGN